MFSIRGTFFQVIVVTTDAIGPVTAIVGHRTRLSCVLFLNLFIDIIDFLLVSNSNFAASSIVLFFYFFLHGAM